MNFDDIKRWFDRSEVSVKDLVVHSSIGEPPSYEITYKNGDVLSTSRIQAISDIVKSHDSTYYEQGFNDCKKAVMSLLIEEGLEALAAHIETDLLPHKED